MWTLAKEKDQDFEFQTPSFVEVLKKIAPQQCSTEDVAGGRLDLSALTVEGLCEVDQSARGGLVCAHTKRKPSPVPGSTAPCLGLFPFAGDHSPA